jgi:antibiotic biosynthesis monooxygenase (ABM) superfamily enzyme
MVYVSEMSVDFSKIPIDFAVDRGDKGDPIIEYYNILEKHKPTLRDILGVLKRNYFMPRDFSDKLMIDHMAVYMILLVVWLTYLAMPVATRLLRRWLYPRTTNL